MAAGKGFDQSLQVYGKGQCLLAGSFAPNGASQPLAAGIKGMLIQSVLRNSAGNWTVTAKITCKDVIADLSSGRQTTNADGIIQNGNFANVGTGTPFTFVVRNLVAAVETDIAANANNRISFALVLQLGAIK